MKRMIPVFMAFAIAGAAFANGLGGERLEKVVGDHDCGHRHGSNCDARWRESRLNSTSIS